MKIIFEYLFSQEEDCLEGNSKRTMYKHTPTNGIYVADKDYFTQQHYGVGFTVYADAFCDQTMLEMINVALNSIYLSLDNHTHNPNVIKQLWNIVNQTTKDSFYDDCKNYVININTQQSVFLVSQRFDTPLSVKIDAQCTRLFLWAYLTMLESPNTKIKLQIELPIEGFNILRTNGEST